MRIILQVILDTFYLDICLLVNDGSFYSIKVLYMVTKHYLKVV